MAASLKETSTLGTSAVRLPPLTPVQAVEAARLLAPRIRARVEATEAARHLAAETVEELSDAGLFDVAKPQAFGGAALGFRSIVEVAMTIAESCGSSGWVYGVLAGHTWLAALFGEQAQREVFKNPRALVASVFRLAGKVTPVADGFHLQGGEGRFCTGVDFADWVIVGNAIERSGQPREAAFFLLPKSDVVIVDDWFTAGMRGTGSRSIKIADAFIPTHRMIRMSDLQRGTTPGANFHQQPLFRIPFGIALPFTLIGAPLGMAQGAVTSFADGLHQRLAGQSGEQIAEHSATFARLSEAAATIDSASTLVLADAARLDSSSEPAKPIPDRALVKRNVAYAMQRCRYAVTSLFEASGGSGIYDGSSLQRIWRDINSAGAHVAFTWDAAATQYGRARAQLPPAKYSTM